MLINPKRRILVARKAAWQFVGKVSVQKSYVAEHFKMSQHKEKDRYNPSFQSSDVMVLGERIVSYLVS